MGLPAFALLAAAAAATPQPLADAAHAIQVGRLDQARMMIGDAIKTGAKGDAVQRLLADLAFARNQNDLALRYYQDLLSRQPNDGRMLERAGIAALRTGDVATGWALLDRATALPSASWRAWDARAAAADRRGDWQLADFAYDRAEALAPDQAEIANNRGWSHFLRGDWPKALEYVQAAAARDAKSPLVANNLELVTAALSDELPKRRPGESDDAWAARLNDAGVVARMNGSSARAVAAFTQALEARSRWYDRAANNLALAEARP